MGAGVGWGLFGRAGAATARARVVQNNRNDAQHNGAAHASNVQVGWGGEECLRRFLLLKTGLSEQ